MGVMISEIDKLNLTNPFAARERHIKKQNREW